ncbi:MAG: SMC family ATPase [Acidimicrobiia bacterium]|nr:MAG: SMC family ATPase [Acidimicrobiia bacterium]
MRPIRLTLEGFRSHRDRTVLDLEGRSLVGIVGPNGAGKSSLLDGIAYALYGRTPSDGRGGQKLINARTEAARVELWFRAGDGIYRVTRMQRRKGTSQQALERWDGVDGTKLETVADKKADIGDAVEGLVGLDFEAFARSVLLAQNRFADLLTAPPAEAAKVLTGLFGFGMIEEMRRVASRRLGEVQAELRQVEQAKASLVDVRTQAVEAERRASEAEATRTRLGAVVEDVSTHDGAVAEADRALAVLAEEVARFDEAVRLVPSAEERLGLMTAAEEHASRFGEASAALDAARSAALEAKEAVDAALATDFPGAISGLASAIERSSELARRRGDAERAVKAAEEDHARARTRCEAAVVAAAEAKSAVEAAREAVEGAVAHLSTLEQGHAAHLLAEGLAEGDPCPVCAQTVGEVPELPAPEGLDEARVGASTAREALRVAEQALIAATADVARTAAELEAANEAVGRTAAALEESSAADATAGEAVQAAVAAVGEEGAGPLDALSAARTAWETLQHASSRANAAVAGAEAAVAAVTADDPTSALADLIERARPLATLTDHLVPRVVDGPTVAAFLSALDAAALEARQAHGEARADLDARRATALAARAEVLESAGIAGDGDPVADLNRAGEDLAAAQAESRLLAARVSQLEEALQDAERTSTAAVQLARLQGDLAPGRFPQYLLDERRRGLADHGSEHLEVLSGGRYRFVLEDNQFKVRDLSAADVIRDADTLSGGELFLASLALALGLATLVGLDRGTLEAFFIDEGFGSLDDDSLELAMDGLERMAAEGDRLVVVVSHVPEMRERLGDLVELAKDPLTNDTVVIRG